MEAAPFRRGGRNRLVHRGAADEATEILAIHKAVPAGPPMKADGSTRQRTPKVLRDTFASQLLTAGVQLGYVSRQLGHSNVSVTARHYARWAGGDAYRSPLEARDDEVPADLLSRLAAKSPQNPHSAAEA